MTLKDRRGRRKGRGGGEEKGRRKRKGGGRGRRKGREREGEGKGGGREGKEEREGKGRGKRKGEVGEEGGRGSQQLTSQSLPLPLRRASPGLSRPTTLLRFCCSSRLDCTVPRTDTQHNSHHSLLLATAGLLITASTVC